MADIWFISDTHFFHEKMLTFKDESGKNFRGSLFKSAKEMNEEMVSKWNEVVKPQDKVYHLGDVACGVKEQDQFVKLMNSLNGHLRLTLGNHDRLESPGYRRFEKIDLWTGGKFKEHGFVATHIPLRKDQMRGGEFCVHGHVHTNLVKVIETVDPRYICVCVEHTNYAPVHLDTIKAEIARRR